MCVGGVSLGRKERFKVLLSLPTYSPQHTNPSLPPEHLIMYLGKETSTLGITGLTFLRIASP